MVGRSGRRGSALAAALIAAALACAGARDAGAFLYTLPSQIAPPIGKIAPFDDGLLPMEFLPVTSATGTRICLAGTCIDGVQQDQILVQLELYTASDLDNPAFGTELSDVGALRAFMLAPPATVLGLGHFDDPDETPNQGVIEVGPSGGLFDYGNLGPVVLEPGERTDRLFVAYGAFSLPNSGQLVLQFPLGAGSTSIASTLVPLNSPELDLRGSWQTNVECNGVVAGTRFSTIAEDLLTGAFTQQVAAPCGSVALAGDVREIASCSSTPSPVSGQLSGASGIIVDLPTAGMASYRSDFATPFAGACGATPIGAIVTEARIDGTITETNQRLATRVEGTLSLGDRSWRRASDDAECFLEDLSALTCSFDSRRTAIPATVRDLLMEPLEGIEVLFEWPQTLGEVRVTRTSESAIGIPPNFRLVEPPLFYDVQTTVTFSGDVTVCIAYEDDGNGCVVGSSGGVCNLSGEIPEASLQILHAPGGVPPFSPPSNWFVDTPNDRVCASVDSLSPFTLATPSSVPAAGGPWRLAGAVLLALAALWVTWRARAR